MVAIAAFLIICVILFGVEAVRGFFFGTLGVLGWVIFGIMALGGILYLSEWWQETRKIEKEVEAKRKAERAKTKAELARLKKENPAEYKRRTDIGVAGKIIFGLGITAALMIVVMIVYALISKR